MFRRTFGSSVRRGTGADIYLMPCSASRLPYSSAEARNPSGSEILHGLLATYRNHQRCLGPPVHFNRRCAYQADREPCFAPAGGSGNRRKVLIVAIPLTAPASASISVETSPLSRAFSAALQPKTRLTLSTAKTPLQAHNENACGAISLSSAYNVITN
jgi:hypothetical protein